MQKLLKAWDDAVALLNESPEEGQSIIAEAVGSDLEELRTAFEGVEIYDLEYNKKLYKSGELQALLKDVEKVAKRIGLVEVELDPNDILAFDLMP